MYVCFNRICNGYIILTFNYYKYDNKMVVQKTPQNMSSQQD